MKGIIMSKIHLVSLAKTEWGNYDGKNSIFLFNKFFNIF